MSERQDYSDVKREADTDRRIYYGSVVKSRSNRKQSVIRAMVDGMLTSLSIMSRWQTTDDGVT